MDMNHGERIILNFILKQILMNIIKTAEERRLFWLKLSHRWKSLHWIVGLIGLVMSGLAAATQISRGAAPYFSLVATLCIGIIGFASPEKRAQMFIEAYGVIDNALLEYELTMKTSNPDEESLVKAIKKAEGIANPGISTNSQKTKL